LRPSRVWLALHLGVFATIVAFFFYYSPPPFSYSFSNGKPAEILLIVALSVLIIWFTAAYPLLRFFRLRVTMDGKSIRYQPVFAKPRTFSVDDITSAQETHIWAARGIGSFRRLVIALSNETTVDVEMFLEGYAEFVSRLVEYQVNYLPYKGLLP
ncbi:MAG: hypothetical protein AB7U63_18545, partial [Porticoccaceae bacterium]